MSHDVSLARLRDYKICFVPIGYILGITRALSLSGLKPRPEGEPGFVSVSWTLVLIYLVVPIPQTLSWKHRVVLAFYTCILNSLRPVLFSVILNTVNINPQLATQDLELSTPNSNSNPKAHTPNPSKPPSSPVEIQ